MGSCSLKNRVSVFRDLNILKLLIKIFCWRVEITDSVYVGRLDEIVESE